MWLWSVWERRDVCRRRRQVHLHLQGRLGRSHLRSEYVSGHTGSEEVENFRVVLNFIFLIWSHLPVWKLIKTTKWMWSKRIITYTQLLVNVIKVANLQLKWAQIIIIIIKTEPRDKADWPIMPCSSTDTYRGAMAALRISWGCSVCLWKVSEAETDWAPSVSADVDDCNPHPW